MAITQKPRTMERSKVLAITGPPASGKSTITDIISDIGVQTIDTGDEMRAYARETLDDPSEGEIWDHVTELRNERGKQAPTEFSIERQDRMANLVCVAGLREQAEVDWLRENVGPTLVLSVYADSHTRSERYVEANLDEDEDRDAVPRERVLELREQLYDRELREKPYPDHDLTVWNENSVSMDEIYRQMKNVVSILKA